MDNCGGGQRLPPDGDEFPAAYQEFSASPQQYQLVAPHISDKEAMYVCETSYNQPEEARISSTQYIVTSVKEMTITTPEVVAQKNSQERRSYLGPNKIKSQPTLVMTEKKIEIAGYYPKESRTEIDSSARDYLDCTPPPLPLTGPPKFEKPVPLGRSVSTDNSSRKFSLTSDLRRQDDKSEKSVRDKIAMFSSQSNLEAPLFPTNPITSTVNTARRLSKYKSTEDFFGEERTSRDKPTIFAGRTFSSCDLTDTGTDNNYVERPPRLPRSLPPKDEEKRGEDQTHSEEQDDTPCIINFTKPRRVQRDRGDSIDEQITTTRLTMPALTRATSFSGGISTNCEATTNNNGQISRANSLASTFRRNSEDMRRTSLNHLIEQRKKSISKLRGLVIPEKTAVPVDQPITDLPEIKSKDSIFAQQMPKASIQDKWGSQSSLASNASSQSVPVKTATSFKIPAPQILPKYSPAFKRKSLTVCGSSNNSSSAQSNQQTSPTTPNDAPKSLESICSPTRSDYSFEFISSSRSRPCQRKVRPDYDDSDNDSAVSSQSSISRGFSPSTSPVPSERSNLSSERSYSMSLIMEMPTRNYLVNDKQFNSKPMPYTAERTYREESNRSSCDSSSGSNSNPRSPPPEYNSRFSAIPQRQMLKRSSSTETNYSTSSSTLTSGSQASAESLSRRVLKPQSVEAINRKNILASARCRSGQNLSGSPLIQRKFSEQEQLAIDEERRQCLPNYTSSDVKIAYVEVIEDFTCPEDSPMNPAQQSGAVPAVKPPPPPQSDVIEPSNDLKMWVHSEAKSLLVRNNSQVEHNDSTLLPKALHSRSSSVPAEMAAPSADSKPFNEPINQEQSKPVNSVENDLIATLTTRSRSRAPINLEDGRLLQSNGQMSLEDILSGKSEFKIARPESNLIHSGSCGRLSTDARDGKSSSIRPHLHESLTKEKTFVSKIPTYGRMKNGDVAEEASGVIERSKNSKIPMQRSLGRRSASVTDVKKAVERTDCSMGSSCHSGIPGTHQRFSSLDSSVEGNVRSQCDTDVERFCNEQFGSISSLASSTSYISPQELAQLVEEASLEDAKGFHDVVVVLLHKENPNGSVGITLAGGIDCEAKEITVHRVLTHSIADRDGRVQRGDRILSINGRSTRGLTHRESLTILKQPRAEVVLVVSRSRIDNGNRMTSRANSVETIVEGLEVNGNEDTGWGPSIRVTILKDGAGLGFSLEGGRDSPLGDKLLVVKKIFTGGAAEKTGALAAGDQLLEVNGADVTRMSRIEVWSLMKKLHDGEVNLLVRRPATKSS